MFRTLFANDYVFMYPDILTAYYYNMYHNAIYFHGHFDPHRNTISKFSVQGERQDVTFLHNIDNFRINNDNNLLFPKVKCILYMHQCRQVFNVPSSYKDKCRIYEVGKGGTQ